MKMEQNIVTGGTSKTSIPRLKVLINEALLVPAKEALHIEHCAATEEHKTRTATTSRSTGRISFTARDNLINAPLEQAAPL